MPPERASDEQETLELEEDWFRFVQNNQISESDYPNRLIEAAKNYFRLNAGIQFEDIQEKQQVRKIFYESLNLSESEQKQIYPIISAITRNFSLN